MPWISQWEKKSSEGSSTCQTNNCKSGLPQTSVTELKKNQKVGYLQINRSEWRETRILSHDSKATGKPRESYTGWWKFLLHT